MSQHPTNFAQQLTEPLAQALARLGREASIEISVHGIKHLDASRSLLPAGTRIYVSHLPHQSWTDTEDVCWSVYQAGFDPIPHLPVRLIKDASALDSLLENLVRRAHINEVLLIAGDYPRSIGPYSTTGEVLASGALQRHGVSRVSVAGHPEGHPKVALQEIREAERDKVRRASAAGLDVTLVTQFFFESTAFIEWARDLVAHRVRARIRAGLAGPTKLTTLFKYALRCGVGPSIRALGVRPTSLKNLIGDHGPGRLICELAQALDVGSEEFDGIHLFSFGGYLHTCEWLHAVAEGRLGLKGNSDFGV